MYNSTNIPRLTLTQYCEAFGLPRFLAVDWKAFSILYIIKTGLSPNLYHLLIYSSGLLVELHRLVLI